MQQVWQQPTAFPADRRPVIMPDTTPSLEQSYA